ncbi:hypothetical protein [Pseudomonas mosselii]|uniref:hypothetical protein n=1 Tax=Pseudomonas mosselii TaxID=78327 RepID=UPI000BB4CB3D|nr:hypothetical protein [Pseudomonas mosselii]ATB63162.1 hypothetical protein CLJ08_00345 [Pseudomonas mosselii]MBS9763991.1 hypothetical protein [Pseudomonas mosselii]MCH7420827.1 hypothetical protein [Pseudomonas mosselii]MCL8302894.1 hypothetical protein [Pseudomonas mosselii]MCL8342534.1 hypothetical protein [Pseudomonas mosselii]
MSYIYLTLCTALTGWFLDWICKPILVRRWLYLVFQITGITACTQLGAQEVLYWDGGAWGLFFSLAGFPLLFERSSWYERNR